MEGAPLNEQVPRDHFPATIVTSGATERTRRHAAALWVLLLAVSLGVLATVAREPGPVLPAFLPSYSTGVVIADLLTAFLLLNQARLVHRLSLFILASAYLFSGLIATVQLLVFPGVFSEHGLLGAGTQSAIWLWMMWHGGFPLFLIGYAVVFPIDDRLSRGGRARRRGWTAFAATVAIVAGCTALTTAGHDWLPVLVVQGNYGRAFKLGVAPFVFISNGVAVVALLLRTRLKTVVQIWLAVAAFASLLDALLTLESTMRYSVGWYMARIDSMIASAVILAAFLSEMIRLYGEVMRLNERLSTMAAIDGLTGIANRRRFDEALEVEWLRAARQRWPLALLMIDVDYFKRYNDALGHPAGDSCLKAVAAAAAACPRRAGDLAARYGGEEFVVLLPGADADGALAVARQLGERVRALGIHHPNGVAGMVTVSIGVASMMPTAGRTPDMLLQAADAALYAAKDGGRDRAMVAQQRELGVA
jgi:diguanylate cyclase (GGDEF)-like protein